MNEINSKKYVSKKLIISGNVVEYYEYENGYIKGGTSSGGRGDGNGENQNKNRKDTISRAQKRLRRLINSNAGQYGDCTSKFFTLTFGEQVEDIEQANIEFKNFIKRLNWKLYETKKRVIKYSAVIEFQKTGRIHYHIIFYNLPYTHWKTLLEVWRGSTLAGGIDIRKIDHVDNVGAYMVKYMGKESHDDRLKGKKMYFNSRGLKEPLEILDKKEVENLVDSLPRPKFETTFDNDYLGDIKYSQHIL